MKGFFISMLATLQLLALVPVVAADTQMPFTDVPQGYWAKTYIETLWSQGIVNGRTAAIFAPGATITRAELLKMVTLANHFTVQPFQGETTGFADVAVSHTMAAYIVFAKEKGWVTGSNGYFYPERPITRFEAVKILLKAFTVPLLSIQSTTFVDVAAGEQAQYIETARSQNIVQGYSSTSFRPNSSITRAEVSKIVALLLVPPPAL